MTMCRMDFFFGRTGEMLFVNDDSVRVLIRSLILHLFTIKYNLSLFHLNIGLDCLLPFPNYTLIFSLNFIMHIDQAYVKSNA